MIEPISRGVLVPPPPRGMTAVCVDAPSPSLRAQRSNPSCGNGSRHGLLRSARNDVDGAAPLTAVILRAGGGSSTPRLLGSIIDVSGILGPRPPCAIAHSAGTTSEMVSRSRGADRPSLDGNFPPSIVRGRRECRMRAAPAVSCAMCTESARMSIQGSGGNPTFPAQWLYGL